jgi:hypothetical protein
MRDLRWTNCHCDKCLSPSTSVSPVSIIPPMLHAHLHLSTTLIRRTSGRSLCTSKYSNALSDIGVLSLFSCFKEFIKVSFSSEYFIVPSAIQELNNTNITIINLTVVLCGCQTWSLTLREEHRPREPENRVLREAVIRRKEEVTRNWRQCGASWFVLLSECCYEENAIGETLSGRMEKRIQSFRHV